MNLESDIFGQFAVNEMYGVADDDLLRPSGLGLEDREITGCSVTELQRAHSTTGVPFGQCDSRVHGGNIWADSSHPMPIRSARRSVPDELASYESSQSLLATDGVASFTDDSTLLLKNQALPGLFSSTGRVLGTSQHLGHVQRSSVEGVSHLSQTLPTRIPAPGGHWAWIPEPCSTPAFQPQMVPVPQTMNLDHLAPPMKSPTTSEDKDITAFDPYGDIDFDVIDELVALEVGEELAPARPMHSHRMMKPAIPSGHPGSCPLPALLADCVSGDGEGSGSDDTMATMNKAHGFLDLDGMDISLDALEFNVPVMRLAEAKREGLRIVRSAPHDIAVTRPALGSGLVAASYPSALDRPIRSAARRSLAVTAAALQDAASESDSEDTEEGGFPSSYGVIQRGRSSSHRLSHQVGLAVTKKKHNPWSLEETLALVEGVKLAGVGKWAEIKRLPMPHIGGLLASRSAVDLKDKWRNLTRVARLPKAQLKARLQRSPSDVPPETMLLVKQLMEAGGVTDHE